MGGLEHFFRSSISIKRRQALGGGQYGAAEIKSAGVTASELMPMSPELATRLGLQSPYSTLQIFIKGPVDLKSGDYLSVDGQDYPVRSVAKWSLRGKTYYLVLVEQLKKAGPAL